jgi:ribosomal protein S18 acetylase RimI-like enzyme
MSGLVRAALIADVPRIVGVHESAFPGFLLTSLGRPFLSAMYRGFVAEPGGILLVAEQPDSRIVGLLAGTSLPAHFFRTLRRRHGFAMGIGAIPGLLRHPVRVGERLWAAVRYRGDRPASLPGYWLLSSLGIAAGHSGSGIGAALTGEFCERARREGAPGVYLLTDQDDNEAALRFYTKREFVHHAEQVRPDGRRLLILARTFSR